MATIKPSDAEAWVRWVVKQSRFDATAANIGADNGFGTQVLNDVNKYLHMLAPWSWTLQTLTEQAMVDGTQDYTFTDTARVALQLHEVTRYSATGEKPLLIEPKLAVTAHKESPTRAAIQSQSGGNLVLRVWPLPGSTDTLTVVVKDPPVEITDANKSDTSGVLDFPNSFYPVYRHFVLWYALLYMSPERAGSAQVDQNGQRAYSGQLGTAMAMLMDYMKTQGIALDPNGLPIPRLGRGIGS